LLGLIDFDGPLQLLQAAPVTVGIGQGSVPAPPLGLGLLGCCEALRALCFAVARDAVARANDGYEGRDPGLKVGRLDGFYFRVL
jgi:hypothetical protein